MFRRHHLRTLGPPQEPAGKNPIAVKTSDKLRSALDALTRPLQHRLEKRRLEEARRERLNETAMHEFLVGADHVSRKVWERWEQLSARVE